jgi:hypothetical protein
MDVQYSRGSGFSRDSSSVIAAEAAPAAFSCNWVARLRNFAQPPAVEERCDLCNERLGERHAHLVEPAARRLLCACRACALLFTDRTDGRYRRVPEQTQVLAEFAMTDIQWAAFRLPINLAFFFYSSPDQRIVALYPSPGGATQSQLSLSAWHELAAANPVLTGLEADVEALLVNRIDDARHYYRVPIDRCYALVGVIRRQWRGFSGGAEVKASIQEFCAGLSAAEHGNA